MARLLAIGADGARGGWACALLYGATAEDRSSWTTRLELFGDVGALAESTASAVPVAIDVPIGLPDSVRFRACDIAARERLGGARSSVFAPPARYMLQAAGDYPAIRRLVAQRRERDPAAKGLSAQAAGIALKVREVDDWARAHGDSEAWLFECHPELSFRALGDGPGVVAGKHSGDGLAQRRAAIRAVFPDAGERIAAAGWPASRVGLPDLLDAYAALATAAAIARGPDHYEVLGDGERDAAGLPMRMVVQRG